MNTTQNPRPPSNKNSLGKMFREIPKDKLLFGILGLGVLCFEMMNFSTTEASFTTFFGDEKFLLFRWATLLAIALCCIDFGGVARMFTPEAAGKDEPTFVWILFGAWIIASAANAALTWWGFTVAIYQRASTISTEIPNAQEMMTAIPIFLAIVMFVIRILLISAFAYSGDRLLNSKPVQRSRPDQVRTEPDGMVNMPRSVYAPSRQTSQYASGKQQNSLPPTTQYHPAKLDGLPDEVLRNIGANNSHRK